jgi:hypothetical protein
MKLTKEEIQFIINNRTQLVSITEKYLEHLKIAIWKEKDINQKGELSRVADEVDGWISVVKNIKYDTPKKGGFTGV